MESPRYQVEKGLHGAWEVASLVDGHIVRTWWSEGLAIQECRELNRLAGYVGPWLGGDNAQTLPEIPVPMSVLVQS